MRTMNASATLVISQGHHPAHHRSAIPTRAYESGSGHGHDAAPAGHPHPPRPPPAGSSPHGPGADRTIVGSVLPAPRAPPASLRERSAPLDPGIPSHGRPAISARTQIRTPPNAYPANDEHPQTVRNHPRQLQSLDAPLHMSAHFRSPQAKNPHVRAMRSPRVHDREPSQVPQWPLRAIICDNCATPRPPKNPR